MERWKQQATTGAGEGKTVRKSNSKKHAWILSDLIGFQGSMRIRLNSNLSHICWELAVVGEAKGEYKGNRITCPEQGGGLGHQRNQKGANSQAQTTEGDLCDSLGGGGEVARADHGREHSLIGKNRSPARIKDGRQPKN